MVIKKGCAIHSSVCSLQSTALLFSPRSSMTARCSCLTMAPTWTWSPLWQSSGTSWRASSRTTRGEAAGQTPDHKGVSHNAHKSLPSKHLFHSYALIFRSQASRINRLQINRRIIAFLLIGSKFSFFLFFIVTGILVNLSVKQLLFKYHVSLSVEKPTVLMMTPK